MNAEPQPPVLISRPNATEVQSAPANHDRPDWVPSHAVWANGQWYIGNVSVNKLGLNPDVKQLSEADKRAIFDEKYTAERAKATEGLPPGYFRANGLVYKRSGVENKVAVDLPGGYSVDGSHLPGHATNRALRIARIKKAAADRQQAIDAAEKATQEMHEANARFSQASDVLVDL